MRAIDHGWGVARAQVGLGDLSRLRGDHADAQRRYAEALTYLRDIDARPEIARCLSGLGRVALDLDELPLARARLTESLRLCRSIGTRIGVARGLESFAALAAREGDAERAVLLSAASVALREVAGLRATTGAWADAYLEAAGGLPADTVARLRARGRALSAEQAIALAIEASAGQAAETPAATEAVEAVEAGIGAGPPSPVGPVGPLTARELEIASFVEQGRSNKAIAEELVISSATVARHVANIMRKLGFHTRAEIAAWVAARKPRGRHRASG
jgi:DNA-binding NarL/FixJ family response regulator